MVPQVNLLSQNIRLLRSPVLPQSSAVDSFTFLQTTCQPELGFMEEDVNTPKVWPLIFVICLKIKERKALCNLVFSAKKVMFDSCSSHP